jgi:hypothetical protein
MDLAWFIGGALIGFFVPKFILDTWSRVKLTPHKQGRNDGPPKIRERPKAPTPTKQTL